MEGTRNGAWYPPCNRSWCVLSLAGRLALVGFGSARGVLSIVALRGIAVVERNGAYPLLLCVVDDCFLAFHCVWCAVPWGLG